MTTVTTAGLDQLGDLPGPDETLPLDLARRLALETLDEHATASIHDHDDMLRAAVALDLRLRSLLAALDAEEDQ
ncbi:hypothetical protein ACH4M4_36015 [Streptomyces sp. NPDC017254]|uniref:hypothetical protein n=1 Tax=unclassified Streptomyces TaxID=2593676 RepID=UPI0037A1FF9A